MIPDWLPYLLNGLLLLAVASIIFYGVRLGITPMPSSRKAVDNVPRPHPKRRPTARSWTSVQDGGPSLTPSRSDLPDADVVGCELSPIPWLYSRLKGVFVRRPNLTLHRQSVFDIDLTDVDVVVVYLHPAAMRKLGPKFERELRPGTLVLSNTFPVPKWEPAQTIHLGKSWLSTSNDIYVYHV